MSLAELVRQIIRYVTFVARTFRSFYLVLALALVVLGLEYLTMSLMVPLASNSTTGASGVSQGWMRVAGYLGLDPGLRTWLWLFLLVMICRLVLGYVLRVLVYWLGKQVHRVLSGKIFEHILLREPIGQIYTRSIGHYITMAGDDTFKSGTIVSSLLRCVIGSMTAAVGMIVLFQYSTPVFVVVVLFLIVNILFMSGAMRRAISVNAQAVDLSRDASTTFLEALNNLRSLRSLHGERFAIKTYAAQIRMYLRLLTKIDAIKGGIEVIPAIALLALAAIFLVPGSRVQMTDTALFAGTLIILRVFASLGQVATAGSQLLTDIRAMKDIDALIAIAQSEDRRDEVSDAHVAVHSVELRDVSFGYGDRGQVLSNVNFRFKAGHTYAIIGPSGAGKSTLADLILGLSTPDSGVLVVNEGAVPPDAVRSHFKLVEQQPKIFSSTVRENLTLGMDVSDAALLDALATVNLAEMVRALPLGMETRLTYLGENFSGGQRQRLGIARALMRKPDVLILDEATSALDSETRTEMVAKLRDKMRNGIIIFITHDPEIADLADAVLQIDPAAEAIL